tara:strand:- start:156 stop:692 length:537 start_codon:yes stop_codon:yes gene_type:complete
MTKIEEIVKKSVRDVLDFPKEGIVFKDIAPLLQMPEVSLAILNALVENGKLQKPDVIVGIDSRGFLMGNALAIQMGVPFVMARKKGKLPYDKISGSYDLEYDSAELEMHTDSINRGDRVLIHDDLLATGGTAECVSQLVKKLGGEVIGCTFIINLDFLQGRKKLENSGIKTSALATYI